MSDVLLSHEAMCAKELALPPNCFTVRQDGDLEVGIEVSEDTGPHPDRPWHPHIYVGLYAVKVDKVYEPRYFFPSGGPIIRRAEPILRTPDVGRPFYLLRNPREKKLTYSLIKACLGNPMVGKALTGVVGNVTRIAENDQECLVILGKGETIHFLFSNGVAHAFTQNDTRLERKQLAPSTLTDIRITSAWEKLRATKLIDNEERKHAAVRYILRGMVYQLMLTRRFPEVARLMRVTLLREFFLRLSVTKYESVRPDLVRTLTQIDRELIPMLKRRLFKHVET